ncbi:MAG: rhodanese-like domain-containing protein [Deltaproteobacteria bacterium]|nr:rhodanese-like domain-containing protein [Deltaproteobacteria bacterium]
MKVLKSLGKVSPEVARQQVEAGAKLIDVRSPGEFSSGHLPGAQNIPLGELAARLGSIGDKEKPVVIYCLSGGRSGSAKGILARGGFTQVFDLGAMSRWR